jgi:hypothetical protein
MVTSIGGETKLGLIETRTESAQQAWESSDGHFELVAVEHETRIELILYSDPRRSCRATVD